MSETPRWEVGQKVVVLDGNNNAYDIARISVVNEKYFYVGGGCSPFRVLDGINVNKLCKAEVFTDDDGEAERRVMILREVKDVSVNTLTTDQLERILAIVQEGNR